MADETNDANVKKISYDIIDKFHSLLELNPKVSKNCFNAIGVLGIILILRPYRITQTFRHVHNIPKHFIRHQIRLLGRVTSIEESGVINVTHIPILNVKPSFIKQKPAVPLPIHLACLEVSPAGRAWLLDNIQGKQVWFTLLYRRTDPPALYCRMQIPKIFWNTKVNEELIKLGLCKMSRTDTSKHWQLPEDKRILKYTHRLVYIESRASHKGVGMWKTQSTGNRKWTKKGYVVLKSVLTSPFTLIYWVYKKFK